MRRIRLNSDSLKLKLLLLGLIDTRYCQIGDSIMSLDSIARIIIVLNFAAN